MRMTIATALGEEEDTGLVKVEENKYGLKNLTCKIRRQKSRRTT